MTRGSRKTKSSGVVVVYPGVFDPPTVGHMDIIKRASVIFDKVVVAVGTNPDKKELLDKKERIGLLKKLTKDLENVEVEGYEGLTIEFVKSVGGKAILRGIRDTIDLRYELQQANTNRLAGGLETIFMLATEKHALTSSTLIKQIALMGGDVSAFVPPLVKRKLDEILKKSKKG